MSKPRYKWWGYARAMIRAYPERCNDNEREAVYEALQKLEDYPMPEVRRQLIAQYFSCKKPISVAADELHLQRSVAEAWLCDFIHDTWDCFFAKIC